MAMRGLPPARAGALSSGRVLEAIRESGATTRAELVRATGLGRVALEQHLSVLSAYGLVVGGIAPSTGGRPPQQFAFNPHAGVVVAADLGATHGYVAIADLGGATLGSRAVELAIASGPELVLAHVLLVVDELLASVKLDRDSVWATSIGLPGPVDFARGRAIRPPIMPGWHDWDVRGWFSGQLPGPMLVDNDVNVAAFGEFSRSWRGRVNDLLYIKVGTGIGAGVITGGALVRGARGAAGDIGHARVQTSSPVICDCGNEDCVETVASGRALARELRDLGCDAIDGRDVVALVAEGHPQAVRAVRAAGRQLGEVLATAVSLLSPELILIGGDLAGAHHHLIMGIREVIYQRSTALATQSLQIEEARLADRAGIEGCIALALQELLSAGMVDEFIAQRSTA